MPAVYIQIIFWLLLISLVIYHFSVSRFCGNCNANSLGFLYNLFAPSPGQLDMVDCEHCMSRYYISFS